MLSITDRGRNNHVEIDPVTAAAMQGSVVFTGDGNRVEIGSSCSSEPGFRLELGNQCSVLLGERITLNHLFVYTQRMAHVTVGADSGFNGICRLLAHESGRIDVGSGVLFASDIDVTLSDMHSVVDATSGRRINPPADIRIGDRVWIGQRSLVLKGTSIGDGSVIGAMSLVRGPLPSNTVCAGVPARVVRTNATWHFSLLPWDLGPSTDAPPPATAQSGRPGLISRLLRKRG